MSDQVRKTLAEPVAGAPSVCSFCGAPTTTSPFRGVSRDCSAAICYDCIVRFSISRKLARLIAAYDDASLWPAIRLDMDSAIPYLRPGARRAAVELGMYLARRSAAILAGMRVDGGGRCPKTGTDLAPPRLALLGNGAANLGPAIRAVAETAGFIFKETTTADCLIDVELLFQACNYEHLAFEHAVLFVADGQAIMDKDCAVVCAAAGEADLPVGTRCWHIDGYDTTELS